MASPERQLGDAYQRGHANRGSRIMTNSLLHNAVLVIADAGIKAALLLGLAGLACLVLRRASAAVRHQIWSLGFCGAVLLPIVSSIIPQWRIPVLPAPQAVSSETTVPHAELEETTAIAAPPAVDGTAPPTPFRAADEDWTPDRETMAGFGDRPFNQVQMPAARVEEDMPAALATSVTAPPETAKPASSWTIGDIAPPVACVWLAGFLLVMAPFAAGAAVTWRLVRRARQMTDADATELMQSHAQRLGVARRVALVETECSLVPMTVGVLKPLVVLPADWRNWPAERVRFVLLHELAHIRRLDVMYQSIGRLACGLYWFNPLAWYALRRLRVERELACDDCVIAVGETASAYAGQLLEIARAYRPARLAVGIAITRSSKLEERIVSLFDRARPHLPVSRRIAAALAAAAGLLVLCLSVVRLTSGETVVDAEALVATGDAGTSVATESASAAAAKAEVGETQIAAVDLPASETTPPRKDDVSFTFAGTVVDRAGKPAVGLKVFTSYFHKGIPLDNAPPAALTDEHGKFEFSSKKSVFADAGGFGLADVGLVAVKEGYGFAYGAALHFETTGRFAAESPRAARERLEKTAGKNPNVLTLPADDIPIRGRIVNTEGQPVAGATVAAMNIWEGTEGTLDAWETSSADKAARLFQHIRLLVGEHPAGGSSWRGTNPPRRHLVALQFNGSRPLIVPLARTDADGRFVLKGIGRERIAEILVSAPGIESSHLWARTRHGEIIKWQRVAQFPGAGVETFYPSELTFVALPSVPVEGRVTDAKSGQALAGVSVRSPSAIFTRTITDADGKYRLEGLPLGTERVMFLPPAGSRYLVGAADVTTTPKTERVGLNATLTAGVLVRGQATDLRTGQGLRGRLQYFPFQANPHLQGAGGFEKSDLEWQYFLCDEDGRFEIPVLPGPGILAFDASNRGSFPIGAGADRIDGPRQKIGGITWFATAPVQCASVYNLLAPLDPQPGTDVLNIDLALSSGVNIPGRVLSPEGQALTDYYVIGAEQTAARTQPKPQKESTLEVKGYFANRGRRLLVYHPERNLVADHRLAGEPPEKIDIELRPGAIITGRVVDADGRPMERVRIDTVLGSMDRYEYDPHGEDKDRGILMNLVNGNWIETDAQGRFELKGIIPSLKYSAKGFRWIKIDNVPAGTLGMLFRDVTADPGETKDLGDLRPEPDKLAAVTKPEPAKPEGTGKPAAPSAAPNAAEVSQADSMIIRGRVLDPDGKPFAGAKVYVVGMYGGNTISEVKNVPLAQSVSSADGAFEIAYSKSKLDRAAWGVGYTESLSTIAAFANGFGPAWKPISTLARRDDVLLQLVADDVPVTGRVLDLEGQPIAGVKVSVRRLRAPKEGDLTAWLDAVGAGEIRVSAIDRLLTYLPDCEAAAIPATVTDAQGKFRISGIGHERYAELMLEGEKIAYSEGYLVTRRIAPLEMKEAETPPQVARITRQLYGSDFDFAVLPSRPVTGVVRDAETGKGVAGARVFSWRFAGARLIQDMKISTTTDEAGGFRLKGMSEGKGGLIMVMPAADQPYFSQVVEVATDANLDPTPCDIQLHRGIWITGKVTDKATGAPASARVEWAPFRSNEFAQKRMPEFEANGAKRGKSDFRTEPDGAFRVVALPGRGVIAAQATSHLSYRYGAGAEKIEGMNMSGRGPPGMLPPSVFGASLRGFHSMKEVAVPADAESFGCDLELDPGITARVTVVDPDGKPVSNFTANWQHMRVRSRVEASTFDLRNLALGDQRVVFIHHEERKLGKALVVQVDADPPAPLTIKLEPCATIMGRLLTPEGDPIAGGNLYIQALAADGSVPRIELATHPVDRDGRFRFSGLLSGCDYSLAVQGAGIGGYVSQRLSVKAGAVIDLGTVTVKPVEDGAANGAKAGANLRPDPRIPDIRNGGVRGRG